MQDIDYSRDGRAEKSSRLVKRPQKSATAQRCVTSPGSKRRGGGTLE